MFHVGTDDWPLIKVLTKVKYLYDRYFAHYTGMNIPWYTTVLSSTNSEDNSKVISGFRRNLDEAQNAFYAFFSEVKEYLMHEKNAYR